MEDAVFQSLASLTWPGAIVVLGTVGMAIAGIIRFFKKEEHPKLKEHTDELARLSHEIEKLVSEIEHIKLCDEDLKHTASANKETLYKVITKLEVKLEKVSDLIIEVIRAQNS